VLFSKYQFPTFGARKSWHFIVSFLPVTTEVLINSKEVITDGYDDLAYVLCSSVPLVDWGGFWIFVWTGAVEYGMGYSFLAGYGCSNCSAVLSLFSTAVCESCYVLWSSQQF
jgi:hypothetical protein